MVHYSNIFVKSAANCWQRTMAMALCQVALLNGLSVQHEVQHEGP